MGRINFRKKKGMDYDLTEAESPWAGVGDTGRFP